MTSTLIAHCGSRIIDRAALAAIESPASTDTWKPIKHATVLDTVSGAMSAAGFMTRAAKVALTRDNHRMFATIDTATDIGDGGITLAVGVVNSTDKSLPMKFVAGSRVFVCDNLSLRSDLMAQVRRKHTRFGLERFGEALQLAVSGLNQFKDAETDRVKRFRTTEISETQRDAILLRSFDRGLISSRLLPDVIAESRKPTFDYDCPVNTLWVLEQAFTTVLGRTVAQNNPQRFCAISLSVQDLLAEASGMRAAETSLPA